jgi:hypothetical protein
MCFHTLLEGDVLTRGRPHPKLVSAFHVYTASHRRSVHHTLDLARSTSPSRNRLAVRTLISRRVRLGGSMGRPRTTRYMSSSRTFVAEIGDVAPAATSLSWAGSRFPRSRHLRFGQHTRCRPFASAPLVERQRLRGMTERYEAPPTITLSGRFGAQFLLTAQAASTAKER